MKPNKLFIYTFAASILIICECKAQDNYIIKSNGKKYSIKSHPSTGIVGGFHYLNRSLCELGIAHNFGDIRGVTNKDKPFRYTLPFVGLSSSLSYDPNQNKINGFMTDVWVQLFLTMGLQYSHLHFDSQNYNLCKFSVGGEIKGFAITFGWFINGYPIKEKYSRTSISLRYYMPLIRN